MSTKRGNMIVMVIQVVRRSLLALRLSGMHDVLPHNSPIGSAEMQSKRGLRAPSMHRSVS